MDTRPIIIIDGMNLFVRHFMVNESLTNKSEPCGGVVGFIAAISKLVDQFSPQKMYVVWEQGGGCPKRKKIFPEYKANRTKLKSEFHSLVGGKEREENKILQVKQLVDLLRFLPVCQVYVPETECDDVIGYMIRAKFHDQKEALKIIVSSDRDFYQLLDHPNTKIYNPADKSFHEGPILKVKVGKDETVDIPARNYALVRTLTGDDSDNIPGVPGVGFKTALKAFPSLQDPEKDETIKGLLEASQKNIQEGKTAKVFSSVLQCEETLRRNWALMYLTSSTMSYQQTSKVDHVFEEYKPILDKLGFIKTLMKFGIATTTNIDSMVSNMTRSLMYHKTSNSKGTQEPISEKEEAP